MSYDANEWAKELLPDEHNAPWLANAADPARWSVKQNAAQTSFNFLQSAHLIKA